MYLLQRVAKCCADVGPIGVWFGLWVTESVQCSSLSVEHTAACRYGVNRPRREGGFAYRFWGEVGIGGYADVEIRDRYIAMIEVFGSVGSDEIGIWPEKYVSMIQYLVVFMLEYPHITSNFSDAISCHTDVPGSRPRLSTLFTRPHVSLDHG